MKFSIFPQFGAQNSKPVFTAFAEGVKKLGHEIVEHDESADVMVIWSVLWHGRMEQNKKIWDNARKNNKPVLVLEVGCLLRGKTWKVGLNGINNKGKFGCEYGILKGRPKKLGLKLKPWTMAGQNILICGQHTKSQQWANMITPIDWLKFTIELVKNHTDRPIVFRPHPRDYLWASNFKYKNVSVRIPKQIPNTYDDFDFDDDLKNAWAVINPSSNTGILSIINGVPSFVNSESLAISVANEDYSLLEQPVRPDRSEWLDWISHTEWTLDEISSGIPIIRIFDLNI